MPDDQYKLGHPVSSVAVMSMLVALKELDEDDVYAITEAIYGHLDEIREVNKKAGHMSLKNSFRGIPGNVHPGAARFYKWVREYVFDKLFNPSSPLWRSREQIRTEVYEFLTASPGRPELWAWIGAYDYVDSLRTTGTGPTTGPSSVWARTTNRLG